MTQDLKLALYTNFKTTVEPRLEELPEKLSVREFTLYVVRLAREILSSEATRLDYNANSAKRQKRYNVIACINAIAKIDNSSVVADLVVKKRVGLNKSF